MNILFIGKLPPLEGGESVKALNYILNLAKEGNRIFAITNAQECEISYLQVFSTKDLSFYNKLLQPKIELINTDSLKPYFHIPFSEAYFSKLFGAALNIVKNNKIQKIVGWYFEPYALVATVIGKLFKIKVEIHHAGSDLYRLANHQNLQQSYIWMVNNTNRIFSHQSSYNYLSKHLNLGTNKIIQSKKVPLPLYFIDSPKFDLREYLNLSRTFYSNLLKFESNLSTKINNLNNKTFKKNIITIGIYGKISANKGNYELINSLNQLAKEGYLFNFISISGGNYLNLKRYYLNVLKLKKLSKRSWILPFIPHWKIPGFIRSCDVICFLENSFPIETHYPQIPLEVLSQGRCLVLSKEIWGKLPYKSLLIDKINFILINKVNKMSLIKSMRFALKNKNQVKIIGGHAKSVYYQISS